jgi:hypothetical protein
MRTPEEIQTEIAALKALRPVGRYAYATARKIRACIHELEEGIDMTAPEFTDETDEDIKSVIMDAHSWKTGQMELRPSGGWGKLVE